MAKRIIAVLLGLTVLGGLLVLWGQESWFQYFLVVAGWDLARTVIQTWYLRKQLNNEKTCPKCDHKFI